MLFKSLFPIPSAARRFRRRWHASIRRPSAFASNASEVLPSCWRAARLRINRNLEPLFSRATDLLASYRSALRVASVIPAEIARLPK